MGRESRHYRKRSASRGRSGSRSRSRSPSDKRTKRGDDRRSRSRDRDRRRERSRSRDKRRSRSRDRKRLRRSRSRERERSRERRRSRSRDRRRSRSRSRGRRSRSSSPGKNKKAENRSRSKEKTDGIDVSKDKKKEKEDKEEEKEKDVSNFDQNKLEEEMRKRKERVEKWREEQRKKAMENIGELKKEIEEMKQGKKWSLEDDDDDEEETAEGEKEGNEIEDEELDPLDAYMEEVKEEVKKFNMRSVKGGGGSEKKSGPTVTKVVTVVTTKKATVESEKKKGELMENDQDAMEIHIEDLSENLLKCKEALKTSKSRENSLNKQLDDLNSEMQKKQKAYNKILREKEELEKENEELKKRIKRLTFGLQSKPTVDNKQSMIDELQKKIKNLESQLEKFSAETEAKEKSCQEELIRWEEGKKWQAKTQGMRNRLKEKEKEVDTLTKQLNTVKELLAKSDKDKITLQKKLKSSSVTADRVMGVHASDLEKELEELRKTNNELENEIGHMRMHQALPRDSVIEDLHLQNRYLQDKLHSLEEQLSLKDAFSKHSPTELGDKSNREQLLQKENLKVSSENIELRFQLEQANKDLPRLKSQVSDMKEMCELLKKEKAEIERKLGQVRGSGRSGKTIPELEKTIGLMKKVVDKVQKENEYLKQASGIMTSEKMSTLELENKNLKSELEKLKLHLGRQLNLQYEFNAKGPENVMVEIDSLHKELKKKVETSETLRMEKNDLEIAVEKLTAELEEMRKRMHLIESRNLQLEQAERQSLKSVIDTRLTTHVEKTKTKLIHRAGTSQEEIEGENVSDFEKIKPSQASPISDPEKEKLKAENKKLKKELKNLDPSFFEEIEDLKYNYKEEVKKNIILEEKLKQLCEQFHIELESAASVFEQLEAEK